MRAVESTLRIGKNKLKPYKCWMYILSSAMPNYIVKPCSYTLPINEIWNDLSPSLYWLFNEENTYVMTFVLFCAPNRPTQWLTQHDSNKRWFNKDQSRKRCTKRWSSELLTSGHCKILMCLSIECRTCAAWQALLHFLSKRELRRVA